MSLTPLGRAEVAKIHTAEDATTAAYISLEGKTGVKLIDTIALWASALSRTPLFARIGQHQA
ncbi:hypothetical protein, partial [Sphingomonas sp. T9W2]|uniref:hypothetical protein n=1 Tax=Sphingomonas sp. T9W2 TaxID=3143183 RepID=UPI0031F4E9B2